MGKSWFFDGVRWVQDATRVSEAAGKENGDREAREKEKGGKGKMGRGKEFIGRKEAPDSTCDARRIACPSILCSSSS
jgi:hypothetical protein